MTEKDSDAVIGCITAIVKFILIICLWSQLDALMPEKYDTALTLGMLILII